MRVIPKNIASDLIPRSTKGEGDCALHAVLGQWDDFRKEFVCHDIVEKRKIIADAIRSCKPEDALFLLIGEAIKAIIMENKIVEGQGIKKAQDAYKAYQSKSEILIKSAWKKFLIELEKYDDVTKYIENYAVEKNFSNIPLKLKFFNCLNGEESCLVGIILSQSKLYEAYKNYNDECSKDFNWAEVLIDRNIVEEYARFLEKHGNWMLPVELHIIAKVFGFTVVFYTKGWPQHESRPQKIETYNPEKEKIVSVCFNGINHYEQMVSTTEINNATERKNPAEGINGSNQPHYKFPRFFRKELSEQQKAEIDTKSFDADKRCPISLELITDIKPENRFQDIACGQVMDLNSLVKWITSDDKHTCPHCLEPDVRDLLKILGYIEGEVTQESSFPETTQDTLLRFCKLAIQNKAAIALKHLLKRLKGININVNAFDMYGNAAIHYAAEIGDEVILSLLYDFGAHLNLPNMNGDTPLYIAVENCNIVAIRFLLLYGANPEAFHDRTRTPLELGFQLHNNMEEKINLYKKIKNIFQISKPMGVDASWEEIIKQSFNSLEFAKDCLHLACHIQDVDSLYSFIDEIKIKSKYDQAIFLYGPMCNAVNDWNYFNIVCSLDIISKNLQVISPANKQLFDCKDCLTFDAELTTHINRLNDSGEGLIHYAMYFNNPLILAILFAFGADINLSTSEGFTPLDVAIYYGYEKLVEMILTHEINIPSDGIAAKLAKANDIVNTKLRKFKEKFLKYKEVIEIFANTKPMFDNWDKLNQHFWGGRTMLHHACQRQDRFMAAKLLQMGAEVDARDEQGLTPLMLTALSSNGGKQNAWLVYTLQAHGADINARDDEGYSPLHHAICYFNYNLAVQLLQLGADPYREYKISNSRTIPNAFIYAVSQGIEAVGLILRAFNQHKYGKTDYSLHTAIEVYNTEIKLANGRNIIEALIFTDAKYADSAERYIVCKHDINEVNDEGELPIFIAIRLQKVDVVECLIKNDANIELRNNDGQSILEFASSRCNQTILKIIRRACLFRAIEQQDINQIEELIHEGVDLITEHQGQSVIKAAEAIDNERLIHIIQEEYDHQWGEQLSENFHYSSDFEDKSDAEGAASSDTEDVEGNFDEETDNYIRNFGYL